MTEEETVIANFKRYFSGRLLYDRIYSYLVGLDRRYTYTFEQGLPIRNLFPSVVLSRR